MEDDGNRVETYKAIAVPAALANSLEINQRRLMLKSLQQRPVLPPSPITANQFSARPLLYAFWVGFHAFRYVTLSEPHHVDTIFSHQGNGAPRHGR